jgi:hypothetical protein
MKRPSTTEEYYKLETDYAAMTDLAQAVTDTLNAMSNDRPQAHLAFCLSMENQHRTLQQAFTRLCVAWLMHAGDQEYRFDLRNEGTHQLAISLRPMLETTYLPFI